MRYYVIINGVNSLTIQGLAISKLPSISKPMMRNMREEIDGRDGDITTELGYGAYDKSLEIGLFGNYDINEIIAFFNSKGTIVFSDEPDKFYNFEILEKIDFEKLLKFKTAIVSIHCQPFKYPLTETPQEIEYEYVEASGDSAFIDNTEAEKFKSVELLGQTSQTTYTGKNKWYIADQTTSSNSVSITIKDGEITLHGTADDNAVVSFTPNPEIVLNGTYKLNQIYVSGTYSGGSGANINVRNKATSSLIAGVGLANSNVNASVPINSDTSVLFAIFITTGSSFNNFKIKPQLTLGTTADYNFEQYVGGVPSPNPSYPQPVNVVSGDNSIEVCGKNLFNVNGGFHYYTNASGVTSDYVHSNSTDYIPCVGGTAYNISGTAVTTVDNNFKVAYFDENKGFISRAVAQVGTVGERKGFTSTAPNNAKYVMAQFYDNITDGQFEKASSMTNYEPYVGTSYPVYLGVDNLFDGAFEQGGISFGGDGTTSSSTTRIRTGFIEVKPSTTYTISSGNTNIGSCGVGLYKSDNSYDTTHKINYGDWNNFPTTITTESDTKYIRMTFRKNDNSTITPIGDYEIQLEEGSKVNHFTPYGTTPIELCKIGTYQDSIYKGVGNNLLDASTMVQGIWSAGATPTIGSTTSTQYRSFEIALDKGTYSISFDKASNVVRAFSSYDYSGDATLGTLTNGTKLTFTMLQDGKAYISFRKYDNTAWNDLSDFAWINVGSSTQYYEPYNAKDKWVLHKEVGKYTFTGNETFSNSASRTTANAFCCYTSSITPAPMLAQNSGFFNRGAVISYTTTSYGSNYFAYNSNQNHFLSVATSVIPNWDSSATTEQKIVLYKNYLANVSNTIYYILATPKATIITDETLISQLDALANGSSFEPQTNIFQSNNDYPFYMEIMLMKKDTNQATINNDGNIYSKPTIALVGTGIVNIYLNGVQMFQVDLSETNEITIDTEHMEAYNPNDNTLANRKVIGDYSKFKLDVGNNTIKIDGALTSATITNYKRWL